MGKHKNHVDRKRNEYGNAIAKSRVVQMERLNKSAPVLEYNLINYSGTYEVYDPNKRKGRKEKNNL